MTSTDSTFTGDRKEGQSILGPAESAFVRWVVPRIPKSIRSYHLTLATLPISALIIFFGYLAQDNDHWLWGVSFLIFAQWFTDSVDGALGKHRKEGLIKWGYYMDHFLDYVFLCSILIAYMLMLPDQNKWLHFFVLAMGGGFMVNSYLAFASTNRFRIVYYGIGPTEARILFIIINTLLIITGKTYLSGALPYALVVSFVGLCLVVYNTQKDIWTKDKENNLDLAKDLPEPQKGPLRGRPARNKKLLTTQG